jgi:hypothetical protein
MDLRPRNPEYFNQLFQDAPENDEFPGASAIVKNFQWILAHSQVESEVFFGLQIPSRKELLKMKKELEEDVADASSSISLNLETLPVFRYDPQNDETAVRIEKKLISAILGWMRSHWHFADMDQVTMDEFFEGWWKWLLNRKLVTPEEKEHYKAGDGRDGGDGGNDGDDEEGGWGDGDGGGGDGGGGDGDGGDEEGGDNSDGDFGEKPPKRRRH